MDMYSPANNQAYWPGLYHSFIEKFWQEAFRNMSCYLPELFWQIRCYLPEHFRQITSSLYINYNYSLQAPLWMWFIQITLEDSYKAIHMDQNKLLLRVSIGRFVGGSGCCLVHRNTFWTTYMAPRKLNFGMHLAFNVTTRNNEKNIGNMLGLSSKSEF